MIAYPCSYSPKTHSKNLIVHSTFTVFCLLLQVALLESECFRSGETTDSKQNSRPERRTECLGRNQVMLPLSNCNASLLRNLNVRSNRGQGIDTWEEVQPT